MNKGGFQAHSETLSQQITDKWRGKEYTDVRFIVENEEVHCHKLVLAARSPYFNTMFLSKLTPDSETVTINTIPLQVFKAVVEFIYTGKVDFADSEAFAVELLQTADMMDFVDLKQDVGDFFAKRILPHNCLGLYQKAMTFREPSLKDKCFTYALHQFKKVKESEEFLEASFDVIKSYLVHSDVKAESEEEICTSAVNWLKHNRGERKTNAYPLLSNLRLHDLSLYYIQSQLRTDALIKEDEQLQLLLNDVFQNILFLKPLPVLLQGQHPRSNIEAVTGIALIRRNAVSFFSLHKFGETYEFRFEKPGNGYNEVNATFSKLAYTVDNTVISVSTPIPGSGLESKDVNIVHKYDVFADQCTTLPNCQLSDTQLSKVIVAENKEIYRLVYLPRGVNFQILSLQKYFLKRNQWQDVIKLEESKLPVYSNEKNMSLISYNNHVYIFGTAFEEENMEKVHIIRVDLHGLEAQRLDFTMPETLTNLSCIVYKEHVLLAGNENCYIVPLIRLGESFTEGHNQMQGNVDTLAPKQNDEEKCLMIDEPAIEIEVEPAKIHGRENTLGESLKNENDGVRDIVTNMNEALNTNEPCSAEEENCVLSTLGGLKHSEKTKQMPVLHLQNESPRNKLQAVAPVGLFFLSTTIQQSLINQQNAQSEVKNEFHLNVLGNVLVKLQDGIISVVDADRVMANQHGLSWVNVTMLENYKVECMAIVRFYKDPNKEDEKSASD